MSFKLFYLVSVVLCFGQFAAITLIEYKVLKETAGTFHDYKPTLSDVLMVVALSLCPFLNTVMTFILLSVLMSQIGSMARIRK